MELRKRSDSEKYSGQGCGKGFIIDIRREERCVCGYCYLSYGGRQKLYHGAIGKRGRF